MPSTPTANSLASSGHLPVRVATDADVPAVTRLINAAFIIERPIFDHDRIDDSGVRDLMAKGKFLLHEDLAKNAIACVYLEPNANDARCYLGLLSIAPDQQRTGLGHRLLAQAEASASAAGSQNIWLRTLSARNPPLRPYYERFGYTFIKMAPLTPTLHPKIPCEFVMMEKRLT